MFSGVIFHLHFLQKLNNRNLRVLVTFVNFGSVNFFIHNVPFILKKIAKFAIAGVKPCAELWRKPCSDT